MLVHSYSKIHDLICSRWDHRIIPYYILPLVPLFLRFDIERKLRLARKQELKDAKKSGGTPSSSKDKDKDKKKQLTPDQLLDLKERSKERKKTVEDRGKTDVKSLAMNQLKARREEKRERGTCKFFFLSKTSTFLYLCVCISALINSTIMQTAY